MNHLLRQKISRIGPWIVLVGLFAFFIWNAWTGIDFGVHWDEPLTLESVTHTIESGILLPQFYNYGGVNYWLALLPILPKAVSEIRSEDPWTPTYEHELAGPDSAEVHFADRSRFDIIQERLTEYTTSKEYRLRVRRIWALVTGLGIFWVFWAAYAGTDNRWWGIFAAAVYGLSWEIVYHSRWIAPDAMAAAFVALSIAFLAQSRREKESHRWITLALIAAGIACGTKYNAGIVLLPVLLSIWYSGKGSQLRGRLFKLMRAAAVFAFSFLLTSPGTILNPLRFIDARQYNQNAYVLGHGGYTVEAGWDHFVRLLEYLALAATSWYSVISLGVFLLALLGIYTIFHKDKQAGIVWLSAPIVYIIVFISLQIFFPRNYLLLIPFVALFASYGIKKLWELPGATLVWRIVLVCLLAAAAFMNSEWLVRTTMTIPNRITQRGELSSMAERYIGLHSDKRFFTSPVVGQNLQHSRLSNLSDNIDHSDYVLFYAREIPRRDHRLRGASNDLAVTWFGPWEVNFNYYPSWIGEDRIVVMTVDRFKSLNLHNYGWIDPADAREEWKRKSGRDQIEP